MINTAFFDFLMLAARKDKMPGKKRQIEGSKDKTELKRPTVAEVKLWNRGAALSDHAKTSVDPIEKQYHYITALNLMIESLEYMYKRAPAINLDDIYTGDLYKTVNILHKLSPQRFPPEIQTRFVKQKLKQNTTLLKLLQHGGILSTAEQRLEKLLIDSLNSYKTFVVTAVQPPPQAELTSQPQKDSVSDRPRKEHNPDNMLHIPETGAPFEKPSSPPVPAYIEPDIIKCQNLLISFKYPNDRLKPFARDSYANKDTLKSIQQAEFNKLKKNELIIEESETENSKGVTRLFRLAKNETKNKDYLSAIIYLQNAVKLSVIPHQTKLLIVNLLMAIDNLCALTRTSYAENTHNKLNENSRYDSLRVDAQRQIKEDELGKKFSMFAQNIHHHVGAELFLHETNYIEKLDAYITAVTNEYKMIVLNNLPLKQLIPILTERNQKVGDVSAETSPQTSVNQKKL